MKPCRWMRRLAVCACLCCVLYATQTANAQKDELPPKPFSGQQNEPPQAPSDDTSDSYWSDDEDNDANDATSDTHASPGDGDHNESRGLFQGHIGIFYGALLGNALPQNPQHVYWGVSAGFNALIAKAGNALSLGINPNLSWFPSVVVASGRGHMLSGSAFLMLRVGAGSNAGSRFPLGVGVGIGGNVTYINQNYTDDNRIIRLQEVIVAPALAFELTFKLFKHTTAGFRCHWDMMDISREHTPNPLFPPQTVQMRHLSIGIIHIHHF